MAAPTPSLLAYWRARRRTRALIRSREYFLTRDLVVLPPSQGGVTCSFPACSQCCAELAAAPEFHSSVTLADLKRLQAAVEQPAHELVTLPFKRPAAEFILKIEDGKCQFQRDDGGCGLHVMAMAMATTKATEEVGTNDDDGRTPVPFEDGSPFAPIATQVASATDPRPFMCKIFPFRLAPKLLDGVIRATDSTGGYEVLTPDENSEEYTTAYRAMVTRSSALVFSLVDWSAAVLGVSTLCTETKHGRRVAPEETARFIEFMAPYWEAWARNCYGTAWFIDQLGPDPTNDEIEAAFAAEGVEW